MTDQASCATRQFFREARGHDRGGRGHQQRILRRQPVELGEDRDLLIDILRPVLLNELDALDGFSDISRNGYQRCRAVGIVGKAMTRQRM